MTFASLVTLNLIFAPAAAAGGESGERAEPSEITSPPAQAPLAPAAVPEASARPAPAPAPAQAPLPPPAPPVDPDTIEQGPWRGKGWFGLDLGIGGPLDGGNNFPSSSRVAALGWGMHLGYRAKSWLGVGLGYHRAAHDLVQIQLETSNSLYLVDSTGYLNTYDLLILRAFLPTEGRVQPWFDLAGGLSAVQEAHPTRPGGVGGQFRLGAGADFWIQQQVSIDLGIHYRLNSVGSGVGHLIHGSAGVTFHW
jgi:hypothetical protein